MNSENVSTYNSFSFYFYYPNCKYSVVLFCPFVFCILQSQHFLDTDISVFFFLVLTLSDI